MSYYFAPGVQLNVAPAVAGDLIVGRADGLFNRLAIGANGSFLNVSAGAIRWGNTIDAGGLSVTAGVTNLGGALIFATDNANDIGAAGANRPRNLFLSNDITVGTNINIGSGAFGAQRLYSTAVDGVVIGARVGTNNDFLLATPTGGNILRVPTGTTSLTIAGDVTVGGNINIGSGAFAAQRIYSTAVDGVIVTSRVGTTHDFLLTTPTGGNILRVPTGTNNLLTAATGNFVQITKAGAPVDGDFITPVDGMIVVDSTNVKLWARVGGLWKGVVIA